MKKIILLFIFITIGLINNGWSQITEAEYFIDNDPGAGNATALTLTSGNTIATNFSIPTSGLDNGLHVLHIRVKGTDDVWSLYFRDYFYILTTSIPETGSDIAAAEYFIDSDPGVGNGNDLPISTGQILSENFAIPTTGLSNGLHVVHVRVKDEDDTWSLFFREYFYIQTLTNEVPTAITDVEYFFDTDPGVGNATSIALSETFNVDETLAIPIPIDMTDGEHYLHLRVKTVDNVWSLYKFALFEVDSELSIEAFDDDAFSVFPNPAHTQLHINFKYESDYSIEIFDVSGKKMIEIKTNGFDNTIDVSKYAKGVYLLKVMDANKIKHHTLKIIKS